MKLKELSLFTGIGGFSYGLRDVLSPIAYCKIDPFCHRVLEANMQRGLLKRAPIIKDVRQLKSGVLKDSPDIITGGFPCQDLSTLGHRAGLHGSRSGLFFELMRIVKLYRPKLVFLENVPALVSNGLSEVLIALDGANYDCRWMVLSAGDLGASHLRRRWFCLAKSRSCGDIRVPVDRSALPKWEPEIDPKYRLVEKDFPDQKARCGAVGNSVVPLCARYAFYFLLSGSQPPWNTSSWEAGSMRLVGKRQSGLTQFGYTLGK
jgi:DNA-cytosine methyltransferase